MLLWFMLANDTFSQKLVDGMHANCNAFQESELSPEKKQRIFNMTNYYSKRVTYAIDAGYASYLTNCYFRKIDKILKTA
jgi:hypothetical protein